MKRTVLFFILMGACCSSAFAGLTVCIEEDELGTLWSQPYDSETSSFLTTDDTTASWNLTFDADPYVESWVSLTNKTSSAKIYTLTFTVDLEEAVTPTSVYGGSVSGSLTAGSSGGGYLSTVGSTPLYLGMIDGGGVLPLYPHPSSWTGNAIITEQSAGPLSYEGTVDETISIQHKFKLGAGDTVTLNGYFEVVPEPATVALLGLGALSLIRSSRRRREP
jgi:hypothetical protein